MTTIKLYRSAKQQIKMKYDREITEGCLYKKNRNNFEK